MVSWRYDFNHSKSGIVKISHSILEEPRMVQLKELYEYKNLGVLKNYVGSFSSNIDDNIDKTRKKVGMIFSSNLDRLNIC